MGMSTNVIGLINRQHPDVVKHEKVYRACFDAGVMIPDETLRFFGVDKRHYVEDPDSVLAVFLSRKLPLREWVDDGACGYELDVAYIPPEVKIIRFYNSW